MILILLGWFMAQATAVIVAGRWAMAPLTDRRSQPAAEKQTPHGAETE